MGRRKPISHEEFVNDVKCINPNITIIGTYTGILNRIKCKCNTCGYIWEPIANNVKHGCGCPICFRKKRRKSHDDFVKEIMSINKDIQIIGEYISSKHKVKTRCMICGCEWDANPSMLLSGHGCPSCAKNLKYSTESFIQALEQVNEDITVLGEYKNAKTPIECKCKKCGNIWHPKPLSLLEGKGCPNCSSSKGEKKIKKFLDDNNIDYQRSMRFDGLIGVGGRKLSYDFYIESKNLLIEFQGKQHDVPVDFYGGINNYNIQCEHDSRKRQYAKDNSIDLLEIWYWDQNNIDTILNNKLLTA